MAWLKHVVVALVLFAAGMGSRSRDDRVGNLVFTLPPGWTKDVRGNVATMRPGDLPQGANYSLILKQATPSEGDFANWVDEQFQQAAGSNLQIVQRVPLPAEANPQGWEAGGVWVIYRPKPDAPQTYHIMIGFRRGPDAGTIHVVTTDAGLVDRYRSEVAGIAASVKPADGFKLGASGGTGQPAPPPPSPPISAGAAEITDTLPPPAKPSATQPDAVATELARHVLAGGTQGLAALERAVLLSGYSIHEMPGLASLHQAPQPNGMSFADIDLIGVNALTEAGLSYPVSSFSAALKGVRPFAAIDFVPLWKKSIDAASASPRGADNFYAAFMKALGRESAGRFTDFSSFGPSSRLSAVQMYLLAWRSVGHTLAATSKDELEPGEPQTPALDALRDLRIVVDSFSLVDWDGALRELAHPTSLGIYYYMLAIARLQIYLAGLKWEIELDEDGRPLVRTKEYQKTGETRYLMVRASMGFGPSGKLAWQKYMAALKACGITGKDAEVSDIIDVHYAGSGNELIQPNRNKQVVESANLAGQTVFSIPIEGSPQQRRLSSDAEKEMKKAVAEIEMRLIPARGSGKMFDAATEVLAQASMNEVLMQSSRVKHHEVPVQDWVAPGWRGVVTIELSGSGSYTRGREGGSFQTSRRYEVNTDLPVAIPGGILSGVLHRPAEEQGIKTHTPKGLATATYSYKEVLDERFLAMDCVEEKDELEYQGVIIQSRPPANVGEASYLHNQLWLEVQLKDHKYIARHRDKDPKIPLSETPTGSSSKNAGPASYVSTLYYHTDYYNSGIFGSGVKDRGALTDGDTVAEGSLPFKLRYTGFRSKRAGVHYLNGSIRWRYETSGKGGGEDLLASMMRRMHASVAAQHWIETQVRHALELDAPPVIDVYEELATCYGVKSEIVGQLKHKKGGGR